ncbi:MAG: ATP-binding protein [Bacteroidales bacterium]|nr:ATP-binding protein [Bacteroidales bacterium]MDT8432058.1 ATP-binding protein [Bacteroidales bacterium]
MIDRKSEITEIKKKLSIFPVTAILGARQTGKTTLARLLKAQHYFDLENPVDLAAFDNPQLTLSNLKGIIVIDEIQRKPELFSILRYLVDHTPGQSYIILGSASRDLIRQSSESLAGRIAYHYLYGFDLEEVGVDKIEELWLRGSFPRSFLAENDEASVLWRDNFITTFLERDIPQLGISIPSYTLRRFWLMLSNYNAQTINYSELSRSFGISDNTARNYIELLEGTFMIRLLLPYFANVGKRIVKSPKLYFLDTGIYHSLLSVHSKTQLLSNNKLGASWETFALNSLVKILRLKKEEVFFYATHSGAELDLVFTRNGKKWGVEFKYQDAPAKTRSMYSCIEDLELEHLFVVYPGEKQYQVDGKITVLPLEQYGFLEKAANG